MKSFIPPRNVAKAAEEGRILRRHFGRGGTLVGMRRASQLAERRPVSYSTIKRMLSFFQRHERNSNNFLKNGDPSNGVIAWLLWGGDEGYEWAQKIIDQVEGK